MATGQGTVTFSFGAAPGTNISTQVVSDAAIGATSKVELFFMGLDSTADHNAFEHSIFGLEVALSCISVSAGVGFTAQAATRLRLTGDIKARYIWAD